jgi:hypothetical protein
MICFVICIYVYIKAIYEQILEVKVEFSFHATKTRFCQCMLLIQPRRLRQENHQLTVILGYITRPCLKNRQQQQPKSKNKQTKSLDSDTLFLDCILVVIKMIILKMCSVSQLFLLDVRKDMIP